AYQHLFGPEDMLAERIAKDRAGLRRQLLYKLTRQGNLQHMPASALQSQVDSLFTESGLAQPLEELSQLEILDKNTQISRMGEGGLPGNSVDAIPDAARNVSASHMGFFDPTRTPENLKAGVDLYLASGARKGTDGRMYSQFTDKKGQPVWRSPQQLADS